MTVDEVCGHKEMSKKLKHGKDCASTQPPVRPGAVRSSSVMAPSGWRLFETEENAACSCFIPTDIQRGRKPGSSLNLLSANDLLHCFAL